MEPTGYKNFSYYTSEVLIGGFELWFKLLLSPSSGVMLALANSQFQALASYFALKNKSGIHVLISFTAINSITSFFYFFKQW